MTQNFYDFQDNELSEMVNAMYDVALTLKALPGADITTAQMSLDMVTAMVQVQNMTAVTPTNGSALSTPKAAQQLRKQMRDISFDILAHTIVNEPIQLLTSRDAQGRL